MNESPQREEEPDTPPVEDPTPVAADHDPVRIWILLTLGLIVALLAWYLAADRFTPFTSQARVDAFVVPIAAQVTGNVLSVGVVNNQQVAAGDELLRLDDAQYRFAVDRAKADLEAAEQEFGAAAAGVDSAAAVIEAAQAELVRADKDYQRLQRIFVEDPGAVSQRRLDLAESTRVAAQSRVSSARAELERARQTKGREGADNPRLQAALAALSQAELELEWTRVRAPAGGLVTDLQLEVGTLAQPGQPLMTFVGINDVWIQADLRENNLGHIVPGAPVDIALDVHPGRIFRGRVRSIGFGVESGSGTALGKLPTIDNDRNWLRDAQRFPVIIELDRDNRPTDLRVGAQATVMVFTDKAWLLKPLGKLYMRLVSLFSFAY